MERSPAEARALIRSRAVVGGPFQMGGRFSARTHERRFRGTRALMKGVSMSHMGKSHLIIMFTVGPDDVAEGDRIFASHGES